VGKAEAFRWELGVLAKEFAKGTFVIISDAQTNFLNGQFGVL
jgi:hypothetical protein